MNQPWYVNISIALIPSLIVAVVTALLTVRLSLRKFYTERWWERKADAYSRIVEALHKYKKYDQQKLKIEMSYPRDDSDKKKILEKQWADANAELQRAVDLGAFVISEQTEEINEVVRQQGEIMRKQQEQMMGIRVEPAPSE